MFFVTGYDNLHHSANQIKMAKLNYPLYFWRKNIKTEPILLSTCNRHEFYFSDSLDEMHLKNLFPDAYFYRDQMAIDKLYSTMVGEYTPVLGDTQIYLQVRKAYRQFLGRGVESTNLQSIFLRGFDISSRIRKKYGSQFKRSSLAYICLEQILGGLSGYENIAILGTGDLCAEFLHFFRKKKFVHFEVFGRSEVNLSLIKQKWNCKAHHLSDLNFSNFDIVISAMSLESPINEESVISDLDISNLEKTIFLFDLGVPPNFSELNTKCFKRYNFTDVVRLQENNERLKSEISQELKNLI